MLATDTKKSFRAVILVEGIVLRAMLFIYAGFLFYIALWIILDGATRRWIVRHELTL